MRLTTLKSLRSYMKKQDDDIRDNNSYNQMIDLVSYNIEKYVDKNFTKKEYKETHNAGTSFLYLKSLPIDLTQTFSVNVNGEALQQDGSDPSDWDFWIDEKTGYLEFAELPSYEYPKGITVDYTGGMVVENANSYVSDHTFEYNSSTETEFDISGIKGVDWNSNASSIFNLNKLFLSIATKSTNYFDITNPDFSGIKVNYSGKVGFNLYDKYGSRFTLASENAGVYTFDPDNGDWVEFNVANDIQYKGSTATSEEVLLTIDQINEKICSYSETTGRTTIGIYAEIQTGYEGSISSIEIETLQNTEILSKYEDDISLVPLDIQKACNMQCSFEISRGNNLGGTSVSGANGSFSYSEPVTLLKQVKNILKRYKRIRVG